MADLVRLEVSNLAQAAGLPGSKMIPAQQALRCGLALKLWSMERKSHVMAWIADCLVSSGFKIKRDGRSLKHNTLAELRVYTFPPFARIALISWRLRIW